jgi:transcriptional regulator with XRE-family HTH domain
MVSWCLTLISSLSITDRLQVNFCQRWEEERIVIILQRSLGHRIRELRTQKGWSQEYLSERCNLHSSHMGQIERGESNVTLSTLLAIAHALDTTVSKMFEGLGNGPFTNSAKAIKVPHMSDPESRKKKPARFISVSVVFE